MKFELIIPPSMALKTSIEHVLLPYPDAIFEPKEYVNLRESVGSGAEIMAYVFAFSAAPSLAAAIKYASPIICEYLKSRAVRIEVGEATIHVRNADDLDKALKAAIALSKAESKQKPLPPAS